MLNFTVYCWIDHGSFVDDFTVNSRLSVTYSAHIAGNCLATLAFHTSSVVSPLFRKTENLHFLCVGMFFIVML